MDKRGQAPEQALEAGKFLFYILLALILFAVFYGLWEIFFKEKISDIVRDRDRVVKELMSLQPDQKLEVITVAKDQYTIQLFGIGNAQKECGGKPCICVVDQGTLKCTVLTVPTDCNKGVCAPKTENLGKQLDAGAGKPILVCRKGNELHLGDGC